MEALANGPLMARTVADDRGRAGPGLQKSRLTCGFTLGAGDGNRTRTISLGIKRGPSAECSLVVFLHVAASHVSNGCARIQPGPTSL